MPSPQIQKAIRANKIEQAHVRHFFGQRSQRTDGVIRYSIRSWSVHVRRKEARICFARKLHHGKPVGEWRGGCVRFKRLMSNGGKQHTIQGKRISRRTGDCDVAVMRRIKAPAEESYAHESSLAALGHRLSKVDDEACADLFDWVVVAIGTERVEATVSELNQAKVKHRMQLDIQSGQPFVFEVIVNRHLAVAALEPVVAS